MAHKFSDFPPEIRTMIYEYMLSPFLEPSTPRKPNQEPRLILCTKLNRDSTSHTVLKTSCSEIWREAFIHGVRTRICVIDQQDWTDDVRLLEYFYTAEEVSFLKNLVIYNSKHVQVGMGALNLLHLALEKLVARECRLETLEIVTDADNTSWHWKHGPLSKLQVTKGITLHIFNIWEYWSRSKVDEGDRLANGLLENRGWYGIFAWKRIYRDYYHRYWEFTPIDELTIVQQHEEERRIARAGILVDFTGICNFRL